MTYVEMMNQVKTTKAAMQEIEEQYREAKVAVERMKDTAWNMMFQTMKKTHKWYTIHELAAMTELPQRVLSTLLTTRAETVQVNGLRGTADYSGTRQYYDSNYKIITMHVRENQTTTTYINPENPDDTMTIKRNCLEYCIPGEDKQEPQSPGADLVSRMIRKALNEYEK